MRTFLILFGLFLCLLPFIGIAAFVIHHNDWQTLAAILGISFGLTAPILLGMYLMAKGSEK